MPPLPPQHCLSVGSKPQGQDKPGLNLKLGLVAGWIKVARDNIFCTVDHVPGRNKQIPEDGQSKETGGSHSESGVCLDCRWRFSCSISWTGKHQRRLVQSGRTNPGYVLECQMPKYLLIPYYWVKIPSVYEHTPAPASLAESAHLGWPFLAVVPVFL